MRYFDCTKFDYDKLKKDQSAELTERDKNAYKHSFMKWVHDEVDDIVERKWQIDNIGIVEETGAFIKLIKEAELSYSLGAYYSSIALVGVASEDLCRYFADKEGLTELVDKTQFIRVGELKKRNVISSDLADDFDFIRKIRNDCLHFNEGFKAKDNQKLKSDALLCVNKLKSVYKALFSSFNKSYEKGELIDKVIEDFAKQQAYETSFGDTLNQEEFSMKLRYFMASEFGLDTAIANEGSKITQFGRFSVEEIDLEISPPEVSLRHLTTGHPFIVDLTELDINFITQNSIEEGSDIIAQIYSVTNHQGMTAAWNLEWFVKAQTKK
ncbi:hypothetical protein F0262_23820 [Vibrio rotiferianus]|uniref:DUF4145 domain-containing protein n=2 Tax=Vibrio harveyi group TaxID=717610 RepID=A0A7Y3ZDP4_9VIBR|nr:hypothetical protein [Vibrio rotiferianus]NOH51052.1 hypothetical protein [Vibrio rotiferianus]